MIRTKSAAKKGYVIEESVTTIRKKKKEPLHLPLSKHVNNGKDEHNRDKILSFREATS